MRVQDASKALSLHKVRCTCCAAGALDILRGRWVSCIMKRVGEHGTLHFCALQRAVPGISKKVLTQQLRHLEQAGLLRREPRPAARPQMFYSLTARGQELKKALDDLRELGARWQHEDAHKPHAQS